MLWLPDPQHALPAPNARNARRAGRGFVLLMVVGVLAVLAILGLQFAEQSRLDLMSASVAQDAAATEALAESGFQMALRMLADDPNVWSTNSPNWNPARGVGWTSRWGYNPEIDVPVSAGGLQVALGAAPSRSLACNFLDTWQLLTWNEEALGSNANFGYGFSFDAMNLGKDRFSQRYPTDPKELLDVWPLQPLARARKYALTVGRFCGLAQIGIAPCDGGIDLNDVYDPGTVNERPGVHDGPAYGGTQAPDPYASPDRRTLEYILGRRPEYAARQAELARWPAGTLPADQTYDQQQFVANQPAGSVYTDNGVYNFRAFFEPAGRSKVKGIVPSYDPAWWGTYRLNDLNPSEPMLFYNAGNAQPNRYNFEGSRYVLWSATAGMGVRQWYDTQYHSLTAPLGWNPQWFPSGRFLNNPLQSGANLGERDLSFQGFGFDLQNPKRGGVGAAVSDLFQSESDADGVSRLHYCGAGMYGHPRPHSFQKHFVAAVAHGRFWTDLMADWYFGGAPGYCNELGTGWCLSNWAFLGSSYDSCGIGSHWMPPSTHVWLPGFYNSGEISTSHEVPRGLQRDPGGMPPVKPAATYAYPLRKWDDDYGLGGAHFTYGNARIGLRASGVQENWGLSGRADAKGRWYDSVNINVSNFNVIYGLLTPEMLPSMLNRTVVAPHLHWKARLLDGAYVGMETFARYDPNSCPPAEYDPLDKNQANKFGRLSNPAQAYDPLANPVIPYDPLQPDTGHIAPGDYRYSLHRHYEPHPSVDRNPATKRQIFGKMDFKTPDPRTGLPADDVFTDVHYDLSLAPNSSDPNDRLDGGAHLSTMMPRPDSRSNWADLFAQRKTTISTAVEAALGGAFKPAWNRGMDGPPPQLRFGEGNGSVTYDGGAQTRGAPLARPHPIHGLPNPDYLLLYPGSDTSLFWADQYRRYFPVVYTYPETPQANLEADGQAPGAPPLRYKLADSRIIDAATGLPAKVNPSIPVPKGNADTDTTPFVPGIDKDEAWRITRCGRKYQEIVADEIMDYQLNPWWPNPDVVFTENGAPLDQAPSVSATRHNALTSGKDWTQAWPSFAAAQKAGAAGLDLQIPDYYSCFNRFWVRAAMRYKRGDNTVLEPYREKSDPVSGKPLNPVENCGIYPQSYQYFGQVRPLNLWKDRVLDFPYNTLDDQSGSEWRYCSIAVSSMTEANMRLVPGRNHPFRNWADFVAFLGHLVYRSPMPPPGVAYADRLQGVRAAGVRGCPAKFFDGSSINDADSLQAGIVARAGYWPICANYGEYYDPQSKGPRQVPAKPVAWPGSQDEWERRLDEWRGRDAAGLRVECNYISERAANDLLVSFSNGWIGPMDFDGDGHITMTRRSEIPEVDKYWPGYPWHSENGASVVECRQFNNAANSPDYGLPLNGGAWSAVDKKEIVQNCVTLPIKFRSSTFRITVSVELTDNHFKNVYGNTRYTRTYSRVMAAAQGDSKVLGPYTGEFTLHGSREMSGADPEMSWLGVE